MDFRDRESTPDKHTRRWLAWAIAMTLAWLMVVAAAVFNFFWGQ